MFRGVSVALYQCSACFDASQLHDWQLRQLPWSMARCGGPGSRLTGVELFNYLVARSLATFDCDDRRAVLQ